MRAVQLEHDPLLSLGQQVRSMGAGGPKGYGSGEYRGLKVPVPEKWQSNVATVVLTPLGKKIIFCSRNTILQC